MKKNITKEGVISGIIASILFTFLLQPTIGSLISHKGIFLNWFKTIIISRCSIVTDSSLIESLVMIIFSALLGIIVNILFLNCYEMVKARKPTQEKDTDKLQEEFEKEMLIKLNKDIDKLYKRKTLFKIIFPMFLLIWIGMVSVYFILPSLMYNYFTVSVEKIAPYVEPEEIVRIKSNWRYMKNWEDYDDIYSFIYQIENEKGLN